MSDPIFIPLIFPTPEFINLSYSPKNIPTLKGKGIFDNGATNNEIPEATVDEKGIRLEFAQFGHFTSFDVIRSMSTMVGVADVDLPAPIVTGLKTMYYVDSDVVKGSIYYYKVRVWRGTTSFVSNEVKCIASKPDDYWDKVVARLTFNTDFTDNTGRVWTPNNNPQISQVGVFSGCLDTTSGGWLHTPDNPSLYLDGDFTIEFWMFALDSANTADNLIISSNQTAEWSLGVAAVNYFKGNKHVLLYNDTGGNFAVNNVNTNEWTHIAYSRKNGILRTFKNGVLSNTYTDSKVYPFNKNGTYLCRDAWNVVNGSYQYDFRGYIDDLRITKGLGRYTSNFEILEELPTHG